MKNFIVLKLQNFIPQTSELKLFYSILCDPESDNSLKNIIDSGLSSICANCTILDEMMASYKCMKLLIQNKCSVQVRGMYIDSVELMTYNKNEDPVIRLSCGNKQLYYSKITELKHVLINGKVYRCG